VLYQYIAGFFVTLFKKLEASGFIGFGERLGKYIVADVRGKKDKSLKKRNSCCHEQLVMHVDPLRILTSPLNHMGIDDIWCLSQFLYFTQVFLLLKGKNIVHY
jgi:hypothetical protein